jgi:MoaA/NifB/PqqE/SkfB family radical SAM enzyme
VKGKPRHILKVNEDGSLRIPLELAAKFGINAGETIVVEEGSHDMRLMRPVSRLAKIYIETTNTCNLGCRTCIRNVWEEPSGWMDEPTFQRILMGIQSIDPPPAVFFGGFGEPLSHPGIMDMIWQVKALGAAVELITNGVYLTESMAQGLIEVGLDTLWVSIDGAAPESYADVRLGAELPAIITHIEKLRLLKEALYQDKPRLGLAFVAMKRNIADLPEVLRIGTRLGAVYFSISNVLAHTQELKQEILYDRALYLGANEVSPGFPHIRLPRMDMQPETLEALREILNGRFRVELAGAEVGLNVNQCPFIQKGSTSIRWDGSVSPCLPLLHTHQTYLDERLRYSKEFIVGSIHEKELLEVWNGASYLALRKQLQAFDFSPCTFCNSCDMAGSNQEDCFGNTAPTCGGCLWAQGLIQCP